MSFVERIMQKEAAEVIRTQQLKTQQESEKLLRETAERERRAKKRQQAEELYNIIVEVV